MKESVVRYPQLLWDAWKACCILLETLIYILVKKCRYIVSAVWRHIKFMSSIKLRLAVRTLTYAWLPCYLLRSLALNSFSLDSDPIFFLVCGRRSPHPAHHGCWAPSPQAVMVCSACLNLLLLLFFPLPGLFRLSGLLKFWVAYLSFLTGTAFSHCLLLSRTLTFVPPSRLDFLHPVLTPTDLTPSHHPHDV